MIKLTRLNETDIIVNEGFIQTIEETPDTVITMQNGHRFSVRESMDDILRAAHESRSCIIVRLTRINGTEAALNLDFIELAEEVPDTVITMKNTYRTTVRESISEILEKAEAFRNGKF